MASGVVVQMRMTLMKAAGTDMVDSLRSFTSKR